MPSRSILFIASVAALVLYPASGAKAEGLAEAVSKVLANHPQVESSKADLEISEQDINEQRSGYFPELSVTATGGRIFGDNATSRGLSVTRGEGYSYLWEGSVTGRQMIFDAFETSSRVASARAVEQSAKLDLADVRESLALRMAQSYINLMRARTGLLMVNKYKSKVDGYLGKITTLVDEGAADETELQQARDVSVIIQNFAADYEGQVKAAQSEYIELTGDLPGAELSLKSLPENMLPKELDAAIEVAKTSHAQILSAQKEVEAAKHSVDAEKSGYYPDVDGELSYLKSDKRDVIGGEVVDGRAVVRLNWDFEVGGAQSARVQKRRLEQKSAMARVAEVERQIERGVRLAYAENETAMKQLENQKKRLDLNEKLFDTYQSQFEGAVISLLQLMQSDNQLFNARLETMNAEHRYVLSRYGILASLGNLQTALSSTPQTSSE